MTQDAPVPWRDPRLLRAVTSLSIATIMVVAFAWTLLHRLTLVDENEEAYVADREKRCASQGLKLYDAGPFTHWQCRTKDGSIRAMPDDPKEAKRR